MELRNLEVHFSFSNKSIQPFRLCPLVVAEEDRTFLLCMSRGQALDKLMARLMLSAEKQKKESEKKQNRQCKGKLLKAQLQFSIAYFVYWFLLLLLFLVSVIMCPFIPDTLRANFKKLSKYTKVNNASFQEGGLAFKLCMCQRRKLCQWKKRTLSSKDGMAVLA